MFQLSCLVVLQCKGFNIHVFQLTVLSVGYATGFSTRRDSCTAPLHPLTKLDPPSTPIEITFTVLHAASADVVSVCLDYFRNKPKKPKSYYTHGITPKRVTSGGAHLRGLAPGQHSSKETLKRWRAVGVTVSDLTGLEIEPQDFRR